MTPIYRNKKTGREYKILVYDARVRTSCDAFSAVVYYLIADPMQIFCRSQHDFAQRYEKVAPIKRRSDDLTKG